MSGQWVSSDVIRGAFARAMSDMYKAEVPQYGTLLSLVRQVNQDVLAADPDLARLMAERDELERLDVERHGAIRLGTAAELRTMGRLFSVMGMHPVGYYDLSVAGVPVHSTAFRPIDEAALARNPFRVFTSLLRLELIADPTLQTQAAEILARRQIFTPGALKLIEAAEQQGGLDAAQAESFVTEALETFRWHGEANVSASTYGALHDAHRLIADVVSFKGPHINHLTPRTLDIDAVQAQMPAHGIAPKATIEGPPRRACPILLRQTSFKALDEPIRFVAEDGTVAGRHTARFGEIELRGVALTPKGRALYDQFLDAVRLATQAPHKPDYMATLAEVFAEFPDDYDTLRRERLAFFRYSATATGVGLSGDVEALLAQGHLRCDPIIYEDFLPVSAAGIFQSNLDSAQTQDLGQASSRQAFEAALGLALNDEMALYRQIEQASLTAALAQLGGKRAAVA